MGNLARGAQAVRETAIRLLEIAAEMEGGGPAPDPDEFEGRTCTCGHCGDQIRGYRWVGEPCEATTVRGGRAVACPGRYRLDPRPDAEFVRFKDGRTLPVTVGQLAMSQAAQDFRLAGEAACMIDNEDTLDAIREGGGS